jgi:hypothetical protein
MASRHPDATGPFLTGLAQGYRPDYVADDELSIEKNLTAKLSKSEWR